MSPRREHRYRLIAGAFAALLATSAPLNAADFDVDLNRNSCQIRLTGQIDSNDLSKLQSALPKGYKVSKAGPTVCLDSFGGDFVGGLKIAQFVGTGYSTKVLPGAVCASVCAWIFISGTNNTTGGSELSRVMDASSRLAFHAPYIDPSQVPIDSAAQVPAKEIVKEAIGFYNKATAEIGGDLIKLAEGTTTYATPVLKIDPSLMAEALVKTGDELLEIKNVGQVIKWGIDVDGLSNVVPRSKDDVAMACRNALAQANHFWDWAFVYDTKLVDYVAFFDDGPSPVLKAQVVLESIASGACSIQIYYNSDRSKVDSIVVEANMSNSESVGETWIKDVRLPQSVGLPNFAIRSPATPLASLVHEASSSFDPRGLVTVGKPDWCVSVKSKLQDEKTVCDDAQLSAYDVLLDRYYHRVLSKSSVNDQTKFRQAEQQWLAQRRQCGSDTDCLNSVYLSRIGKLREQF